MKSEDGTVMTKEMSLEQVRFSYSDLFNSDDYLGKIRDLDVFPNPVTKASTISFTTTEAQEIDLVIYNQLGQIIEHIDYTTIAGRNDLIWNRKSLESGLYFISLWGSSSPYLTIKLILK